MSDPEKIEVKKPEDLLKPLKPLEVKLEKVDEGKSEKPDVSVGLLDRLRYYWDKYKVGPALAAILPGPVGRLLRIYTGGSMSSDNLVPETSKFLRLNTHDIFKGFVVAFLASFGTAMVSALESGVLPDWPQIKSALFVGLAAAGAYLLKNLLSNSDDQMLKSENKSQ